MSDRFAALLTTYLDAPLRLTPEDPAGELASNTVWFGVPAEQIDAAVVVSAVVRVAHELRQRFRDAVPPATFYAWHDQQAGQLRFALGSVAVDALQFGGRHHVVRDPGPVVALLAADPHPGTVVWEELVSAGAPPDGDADQPSFPVFAAPLGRRGALESLRRIADEGGFHFDRLADLDQ